MEKLLVLSSLIKTNLKKLLSNNTKNLNNISKFIKNTNKYKTLKNKKFKIKNKTIKNRGYQCAIAGFAYEKIVHSVVKKCKIKDKNLFFNTQKEDELGGWSADNDIICNLNEIGDIPIEIKKKKTPDWMQCSLKFIDNKWCCAPNSKIPNKSRNIFENIINNINLYGGEIPPFMTRKLTHTEWVKIKKESGKFNDVYFNIKMIQLKNFIQKKDVNIFKFLEKVYII